ncbi:MAG: nitrous oxide reductase family maturation protein NosD [Myxococcota bacterium]
MGSLRITLPLALLLVVGGLVASRSAAQPPELGRPVPGLRAGPVERMPDTHARTPVDSSELHAWLNDPEGPRNIWLKAGVYQGPLHIRRPLTLSGEPGAVIDGRGEGTVMDVVADGVTLENLTVRNSGRRNTTEDAGVRVKGKGNLVSHVRVQGAFFGISLEMCPGCAVQDCWVAGEPGLHGAEQGDGIKVWESHDAVVARNLVENTRDVVVWYSRRVTLDGNTIRNGRYGTHFMYAHDSVVRNSRIVDNTVGIFVMYSARLVAEDNLLAGGRGPAGVGLGFKESDGVHVRRNRLVGNTTGTYLDRTPRVVEQPVDFIGNTFALNDVALRFHSSQRGVSFHDNSFENNGFVVEVEGGGDVLGVDFTGNRWSDYAGYDLDDDGHGDVAFEVKKLGHEITDAHPAIRLFQGTAAMALVDAVAHAIPFLARRQLLVDARPRMREVGSLP